mmetsp:Transcript_20722/g.37194  ORF Transcript_20722/g.37194 Transcript_20722/m.37194 type:complete len:166 (-) Transcript_20722:231-728(-)
MIFFSRSKAFTPSWSLVVVASLSSILSQVQGATYTRIGEGLCEPVPGLEYSYLSKAGPRVRTMDECVALCEAVNVGGDSINYYRGLSHLGYAADEDGGRLRDVNDGTCICHYDASHLPSYAATGEDWHRYDPWPLENGGAGPAISWDGRSDLKCYGLEDYGIREE